MKWRSSYTVSVAGLLLLAAALPLYLRAVQDRPRPGTPVTEILPDDSVGIGEPLPEVSVARADWPGFRGPGGQGKTLETSVATVWSETKNITWKVAVPGRGHSSPVLWNERIFLTSADEADQVQSILCFARETGKLLWSTPAHKGQLGPINAKNSHASPTPVCDGERVIVPFLNGGSIRVTATDLAGTILWQTEAGPCTAEHGYGSSPVIYKSVVIVSGDGPGGAFLAALHRKSGEIIWRIRRPESNTGSYSTPVLGSLADRPQLLLSGCGAICSYDPENGRLIWSCRGPSQVTAGAVAIDGDLVMASGGYPEKEIIAVRADGTGDVTATHVAWRSTHGVAYVPSPLAHEGLVYVIQDGPGLITCRRGDSGQVLWKERLRGNFTASPVLAGNLIYLATEEGSTFVLKASSKSEIVAENRLDEGCLASPAIGGGGVFLRTARHLYCISASSEPGRR